MQQRSTDLHPRRLSNTPYSVAAPQSASMDPVLHRRLRMGNRRQATFPSDHCNRSDKDYQISITTAM